MSTNWMYVSLQTPITGNLFHTVVHLACSTPGATDDDTAFANTCSHFSGKAVKTWDDQPLYYYKWGTTFAENKTALADLLADPNHQGQCGAFQELLYSAAGVNGVWTTNVTLTPDFGGCNWFLVKSWNRSYENNEAYARFAFGTYQPDMVIGQTGHNFYNCTDVTGLGGQNSPWPSQKVFDNHKIILRGTVYYDPSYGFSKDSKREYEEAAIEGYGETTIWDNYGNGNNYGLRVFSISQDPQNIGLKFQ